MGRARLQGQWIAGGALVLESAALHRQAAPGGVEARISDHQDGHQGTAGIGPLATPQRAVWNTAVSAEGAVLGLGIDDHLRAGGEVVHAYGMQGAGGETVQAQGGDPVAVLVAGKIVRRQ